MFIFLGFDNLIINKTHVDFLLYCDLQVNDNISAACLHAIFKSAIHI